jgi:hypothetical protein
VAARVLEQGLGGKDGCDLADRPLLDEPSAHTFTLCHVRCQPIRPEAFPRGMRDQAVRT